RDGEAASTRGCCDDDGTVWHYWTPQIRLQEPGKLLHRPRNHDALDLVRALVDLGDLGVTHHALDRIVVHVAEAAQHLDRLDRHAHRVVGGEQLGHRAPFPEARL